MNGPDRGGGGDADGGGRFGQAGFKRGTMLRLPTNFTETNDGRRRDIVHEEQSNGGAASVIAN